MAQLWNIGGSINISNHALCVWSPFFNSRNGILDRLIGYELKSLGLDSVRDLSKSQQSAKVDFFSFRQPNSCSGKLDKLYSSWGKIPSHYIVLNEILSHLLSLCVSKHFKVSVLNFLLGIIDVSVQKCPTLDKNSSFVEILFNAILPEPIFPPNIHCLVCKHQKG